MFDVSSYLILQREFQIMKSTLTNEKYRKMIECSQKINVNEPSFNTKIKECLSAKNLAILGKVNQIIVDDNKRATVLRYCLLAFEKSFVDAHSR